MTARVGIIAGQGTLPFLVARGMRAAGREVFCVGLRGQFEPTLRGECDALHEAGVLQLGPGESIRRIEAETGTQVDRIFLSGAGQRIGGGGGAGIRRPDLVVPEDRVLLGFSGRIGGRRGRRELVALTPVYAVFGPLRWQPVVVGEDP